ncbi:MAG: aspartate aminotransferase family protein [Thermoleophilaceae bacterium]|nr:aspartate aminotransferase family protein [Thermoleophilaceae bacterium]
MGRNGRKPGRGQAGSRPSLDVAAILDARRGEELALNDLHLNPQFGRVLRTIGYDRTWVRGYGPYLWDDRGDRYLDLLSGYGVFALGRNNPAVRAQLERFLAAETANLPQLGVTLLAGVLAEQLLARAPSRLDAVVLTNSGTESVEAAIKLARASTGRPRVLYLNHGFHGLTNGALSVNGNEEFRERFGPLLPGCDMVPFGDLDALRTELARGDVAAFLVEPVQGKGVNIPEPHYLPEAQELCRAAGTLLVVDEVQTGLGRTGRFLALEHWGLEPDLVLLSKALSGGYVPVGAVLTTRAVFERVFDSMERAVVHGSTFGTNDLAAAAAIATLAEIDDAGLVERARAAGERLLELTRPLVDRYELVKDVRGLGLMWAIEFQPPSGGAALRAWRLAEDRQPGIFAQLVTGPLFSEHRILTQVAGHRMNVIKALPPLVIEDHDLVAFAEALDAVLARLERGLAGAMARFGLGVARRSLRRPRAAR